MTYSNNSGIFERGASEPGEQSHEGEDKGYDGKDPRGEGEPAHVSVKE